MAHQRPQEALALVQPYLEQPGESSRGQSHIRRDASLLAALAARMRGDWQEVAARTALIGHVDVISTGNSMVDLIAWLRSPEPLLDMRATLLQVEAERALGQDARANEHAAALRKQFGAVAIKPCRVGGHDGGWRNALVEALAENEKREFKCSETPRLH